LYKVSVSTFQSDATALDVLQWLTERGLRGSALYLCLCLKLYLTVQFLLQAVREAFQWLG